MNVKDHPFWPSIGQNWHGKHAHQQGCLRQTGCTGRSMFKVAFAIDNIGRSQKSCLCGNPAQRIPNRKIGISLPCGGDRQHTARKAGRHADKQGTGDDLSHAGTLCQFDGNAGQSYASKTNGDCANGKYRNDSGQG